MLNLIKLEIKKFKLQGFVKGAFIAHLVIIAAFLGLQVVLKLEQESVGSIVEGSTMIIGTVGSVTFLIFASVMLAKLVISEYNNKTINLMFMYPISRKKVFLAKLIIVSAFTLINIIISNILLTSSLVIANSMFDVVAWQLIVENILTSIPSMLLNAVLASGTALIPLYFGMKNKSVPTTIVAAVLISTVMYSGSGSVTIVSILPIAIIVAIIGLLVGFGILNKLDTEDII